MYDLTGRVALITGSSMGLGKVFALDLAKAGACVVVNDPEGGEPAKSAAIAIPACVRPVVCSIYLLSDFLRRP